MKHLIFFFLFLLSLSAVASECIELSGEYRLLRSCTLYRNEIPFNDFSSATRDSRYFSSVIKQDVNNKHLSYSWNPSSKKYGVAEYITDGNVHEGDHQWSGASYSVDCSHKNKILITNYFSEMKKPLLYSLKKTTSGLILTESLGASYRRHCEYKRL